MSTYLISVYLIYIYIKIYIFYLSTLLCLDVKDSSCQALSKETSNISENDLFISENDRYFVYVYVCMCLRFLLTGLDTNVSEND